MSISNEMLENVELMLYGANSLIKVARAVGLHRQLIIVECVQSSEIHNMWYDQAK